MGTVVSLFGVKPFRIGGAETYARELSAQLGQLGWKSVLCYLSEPPEEVRKFLTLPNVTIEVVENFTQLNWEGVKEISAVLKRHKPDILHLYFTSFLGIYPWLAKFFSVKQVCFTDQTSRPAGHVIQGAPFWKQIAVRFINYHLDHVVCVSDYGRRCLDQLRVLPSDRYKLIYNAVDRSRVASPSNKRSEFCRRFGIPENRVIVVQVSWIIPEKGITHLLRVAQQVLSEDRDVQFVLVGEGSYREQYTKDAIELGLGDNITWTGLVQDPFGEGIFEAADIISQLSNWEEVFGWMIAEGMAHGKPVVATRVGGIPELVSDNETGYLVARDEIEETAQKILDLVKNPEIRKQLGENGRKKVENLFDLKSNITKVVNMYGLGKD
jgi:glycosyltransferase involved in cell wall biosynthesis